MKNHRKASEVAALKLVRIEMKWRTKNNHLDCGVFVIRHMEHYTGQSKNWDCGFYTESRQQTQLDTMRIRYAQRIVMHEKNENYHKVEFQV